MQKEKIKAFIDYFDEIEDPRSSKNLLYPANEILLTVLCGLICGVESWRDFVEFGEAKLDFLKGILEYKEGIPSKNTFSRFFAALKPEQFKTCFIAWVKSLQSLNVDTEVIAIDGKRLCNSFDEESNKSAIHMISAFASSSKIVLAQQKVDDKSNEITAIPQLLELIEVKNNIITIDAMGTQKEIAKTIINRDGNYILALKGNHSRLHSEVTDFFVDNLNNSDAKIVTSEDTDCGHGRIEHRKCLVSEQIEWLGELRFIGMKSIVCIESTRIIKDKISKEKRFYISSLSADAHKINSAIRSHWSIENSLHWSLDVIFNEDNSRIRLDNAAENIAMARHTVLNLLQSAKATHFKKSSITGLRKKAGWDNNVLLRIIQQ
jgi:predicted transposase YbfD/YdcC